MNSQEKFIREFNCSVFTGFIKVFIIQPFDLIKIRIHSNFYVDNNIKISNFIKSIIKDEGVILFTKGINVTSIGVFISSVVQFTLYQAILDRFLEKNEHIAISATNTEANTNSLNNIKLSLICSTSGFITGLTMGLLLSPIDHIRIKVQAIQNYQKSGLYKYKNSFDCVKDVYRRAGVVGFYVALPMTIARESIACFIYFGVFEYLKNWELLNFRRKNIKLFNSFIYGAFAGISSWIITLPIDIIRTKIISDTIIPNTQKFRGAFDCAKQIYRNSGIRGFYNGFSLVFTRAIVVNGVVLTAFDVCRSKYVNKE